MKPTGNIILDLTFQFSLDVIKYVEMLESKRKFVIANQLLKSGTSIGANCKESQNGESKADFIHKLKIALKEADETEYWLLLCKFSDNYPDCEGLLKANEEIRKVLSKIIATTKKTYINN
ncbi:MAG: four helix bundle protein [Cytophagaceae bacterium]